MSPQPLQQKQNMDLSIFTNKKNVDKRDTIYGTIIFIKIFIYPLVVLRTMSCPHGTDPGKSKGPNFRQYIFFSSILTYKSF